MSQLTAAAAQKQSTLRSSGILLRKCGKKKPALQRSKTGSTSEAVLAVPGKQLSSASAGTIESAFVDPRFAYEFSQMSIYPGPRPRIQAKLRVNAPGDIYEQEADRIADQVSAAPANIGLSCRPPCIQRFSGQPTGRAEMLAPPSVDRALASSGRPLEPGLRQEMEGRFGHDFSRVRVHSGSEAEQSARDANAYAYTVGSDIVFGAGQLSPETRGGRRLIAHELAHVVQQETGSRSNLVQRYSGCSASQDTIVTDDHKRARSMLSNAIAAVSSYNGTTPAKVFNALSTHFHGSTSNAFATWINVNLRFLWAVTWMAGYDCYTGGLFEGTWACGPSALATTFWCVPGVNIRLCPSYFGQGPTERSTTLIHEWVHKYGCNFDLGYEGEAEYPQNMTLTQLLNADSFSSFIRDVQ